MKRKLSASCMVIMMLCASCSAPNGTQDSATMTPSITPFVVETAVIPPTFTTMLTSTPTYAPTQTPIPMPTYTPTLSFIPMPTYIPTPTPITGTPTIIEITPLGGENSWANAKIEDLSGTFTPYSTMNVRWGPGVDYAVRYRLSAGQTVAVFAWISELPFEAWLCLDEPISTKIGTLCSEAVALTIDHKEYGKLVINE